MKIIIFSVMLSSLVFSIEVSSVEVAALDDSSPQELLAKSLNRLDVNQFDSAEKLSEVSNWLVGLPSVSLSLLNSDNNLGTDEYELSVNLPFKTRARKNLDKQLLLQSQSFISIAQKRQALFVSGLIRESIWQYKIALKQREIEQNKLNWLNKQMTLLNQLVKSGGSNLDLLFVEKQLLAEKLLLLELEQQVQLRQKQFRQITGTDTVPENFYEDGITDERTIFAQHPTVQQLQLSMQQTDVLYELSGKSSNPINVSLTALDIRATGANDRQYGIGIEVPIGLGKSKTQADSSNWLQQQNSLSNQLITFERTFSTQFLALRNEHKFLSQKQNLLEQQALKTQQIFNKLEQLRNTNELNQGLFYQRMIELIAAMHRGELNQLYIKQNQSRQKQLAGASL